ncbi:hypothetical protein HELRODRAFT_173204 [Helobdella robusta]|uniref:EDRF1 N-terminal domain-containing protein n=1 Tax=Helobdella robusta TaxID=6412 RepID=T1F6K2_HELRO|nr:hypothetical protein HELRODRAFT_173204 [Helobdella robusta]ESO04116.1 hypothetical protein HELRODRAFT_173204 [Helobdella robusta]
MYFIGHGDDIVKLYDLTTLCFDYNENGEDDNSKTCDGEDFKRSHDRVDMLNHQSQQKNDQSFFQYNDSNIPTSPSSSSHSNSNTSVAINPFTIPVGILLYRVAFNIISFQKCLSTSKKASVIKKLLRDCIAVLSSVNHYRVIVAAHYYLSDVYVCDHIDEEPVYEEGSDTDIEESSDNTVTNSEKYESSDDDFQQVHPGSRPPANPAVHSSEVSKCGDDVCCRMLAGEMAQWFKCALS